MKIQNSKSILPFLACMAVILAWFSPWWIGGKVLAPLDLQNLMMSPWREGNETEFAKNHFVADGVDQYLVYRMVAAESYAKEGWLGWSSLTYGGTAQYANTMALYQDWTMQLHRWFSFWTAWHLGLMGQVMLAAFGMLFFLRGRGVGNLWSCCGALAYAANSQFVTWIFHRWALGSFCWVPWVLWAIDGYRRGKRGFWAAVPAFMAMAFMGGTLQHCAIVVLAIVAIWCEEALQAGLSLKRQALIFGRHAAWGVLGSGLAAIMFLPCVVAFIESNRLGLHMGMNVNASNSVYPMGPLQPLFNLAAYPFQIFPSILGRCDSLDLLKLFKSELFFVAYFGSLPVIIALLAIWKKDTPLLARLLLGFGLVLPLTPLVRLLYLRLYLLFILGGILAFAYYMEKSSRDSKIRLFKVTSIVTGLAVSVWTLASILLQVAPGIVAKLREKLIVASSGSSFGFFKEWVSLRVDRFIGDLFIWSPQQAIPLLLFTGLLVCLRLTASSSDTLRKKGTLFAAILVVCEVSLFASRWIVWSDPVKNPLFAETSETKALRDRIGHNERVTTLIHPTAHMAVTPFIPNTLSAYGIATISGYDSIIPDGMILPKESPGDAGKLGRLAVSHLITWTGNPDVPQPWHEVWQSPSMSIYKNPLVIPRYVGFREVIDKDAFFSGKPAELSSLDEISDLENRREIDVPAGIRWVRISDNQASGWQYRMGRDSEWMQVTRAPDASMLMEIPNPEAPALLEMRYDPPARKLGFAISAASLLLLIAGQCLVFRPLKIKIPLQAS